MRRGEASIFFLSRKRSRPLGGCCNTTCSRLTGAKSLDAHAHARAGKQHRGAHAPASLSASLNASRA
jgi:hypothetical protein